MLVIFLTIAINLLKPPCSEQCPIEVAFCIDGSFSIDQRHKNNRLDFLKLVNSSVLNHSLPFVLDNGVSLRKSPNTSFGFGNSLESVTAPENQSAFYISEMGTQTVVNKIKLSDGSQSAKNWKLSGANSPIEIVLFVVYKGVTSAYVSVLEQLSTEMGRNNIRIQLIIAVNSEECLNALPRNSPCVFINRSVASIKELASEMISEMCQQNDICVDPPNIAYTTLESKQACRNKTVGYVCEVACAENFVFYGDFPVCQSCGRWDSESSICLLKGKKCSAITPGKNYDMAKTENCEGKPVGSTCNVVCNEDFIKMGTDPTCVSKDLWSPMPFCLRSLNKKSYIWPLSLVPVIFGILSFSTFFLIFKKQRPRDVEVEEVTVFVV